ncbi:MAG: AEC family transporter [Spirochaetes bacterium]|nr:AEC family transporter [Spirochaetota bacterium]
MIYFLTILNRLLFVVLIMGTGILAKKLKLISEQGERDLSRVMVDLVWPGLIFSSITRTLRPSDILDNLALPFLCIGVHLMGWVIGSFAARVAGYKGDQRRVFLFQTTMNNFLLMALPFAEFFYPGKGTALLAVANLGSILMLWTVGASTIAGPLNRKELLGNLLSPGMIATVLAILFVLTGWNRSIPPLIAESTAVLGQPTLFMGLFVAGARIYELGFRALKLDRWNLLCGSIRILIVPGLAFLLALSLTGVLPQETLVMFMLVSMTPASVNSVTMAFKYNVDPKHAAEGVVFTHVFGLATMTFFVLLIVHYLAL